MCAAYSDYLLGKSRAYEYHSTLMGLEKHRSHSIWVNLVEKTRYLSKTKVGREVILKNYSPRVNFFVILSREKNV